LALPNEKFSTTHHAEGNGMASPTQIVGGKGIPNSLIAENLLKILRDLIPSFPPKSFANFRPWKMVGLQKAVFIFSIR